MVEKKDMFIDIGASTKEEIEEAGIRIGEPVVPWGPFDIIRDGKIAMGKAFDDRIGTFAVRVVFHQVVIGNTAGDNSQAFILPVDVFIKRRFFRSF